jgi:hypothetical protein
VNWDDVTLVILAASGCVTLLLTEINDVLSRLPQVIRAWRQIRQELSGHATPPEKPLHTRVRAPEMPPNCHQRPTTGTSSTMRT